MLNNEHEHHLFLIAAQQAFGVDSDINFSAMTVLCLLPRSSRLSQNPHLLEPTLE